MDCVEYGRAVVCSTRLNDCASRAKEYLFSPTDIWEPRDKATRLVDYSPSRGSQMEKTTVK